MFIYNHCEVFYLLSKFEEKTVAYTYIKIFVIENQLRRYVSENMKHSYGDNWIFNAPRIVLKSSKIKSFEKLQFYEYESLYLRVYPIFNLSDKFYFHLHQLFPLRNKVSHYKKLSKEEIITLTLSSEIVISELGKSKLNEY